MDYPKRLIEVDLPIKRISAHSRREKSIRHGHIATLHIWWARRPLAACRAVICAALWPDPADDKCPSGFRDEARRLMTDWAENHLDLTSPDSMSRFNRVKNDPTVLTDNVELRKALLDFIADFANWDNSANATYIKTSGALTQSTQASAHGRPLVVDSFAGGGAIPLEALRCGADAYASDINPLPVLLNRVALEFIPRFGSTLAEQVGQWGRWINEQAREELTRFYPTDTKGVTPIAYLWARTAICEGPGCGAVVPVMRTLWLAKKGKGSVALRLIADNKTKQVSATVVHNVRAADVGTGTVGRGAVTCPCCGFTTPVTAIRRQLRARRGGGHDALLLAIRQDDPATGERTYRDPTQQDRDAAAAAEEELRRRSEAHRGPLSFVPDEKISVNEIRRLSVPLYGMEHWGDVFTPRQALALATFAQLTSAAAKQFRKTLPEDLAVATHVCLALAVSRLADFSSSLCVLNTVGGRGVKNTFARQALPMVWDFIETNPFNEVAANWLTGISSLESTVMTELHSNRVGAVSQNDAAAHALPDDSAQAFVTDPPYYDAVPYAHLSDFFYVWLRRCLFDTLPALFDQPAVPKDPEIVVDRPHELSTSEHDIAYYERQLAKAFGEGRRILCPDGVGVIVFASKSTASWEAVLAAIIAAGFVVTGSWPIDTEREARMAAYGQARLSSSIHIVVRPRENPDGTLQTEDVGDWRAVLALLPKTVHAWMPRLAEEGVVGADAIFACLGPALEIFSRYSRVEKASGEVVTLREYLEQVWAAVSTEALSMIFRDADTAGLESDARFTAIVLWTLSAGGSGSSESEEGDVETAEGEDDEDEPLKGKATKGGYMLEYDAARKIAQGLGVNLEQIDSVVEVKGDKARLLPVSERAATLFGKAEKVEAATKKRDKKATQKKLFDKDTEEGSGKTETMTLGDTAAATPGVTALDRVHQAMLLFGDGRADALKRFIVEDGVGGDARFWKLAQSLSALYPAGSDEKRWVDGVLARKKSFGF